MKISLVSLLSLLPALSLTARHPRTDLRDAKSLLNTFPFNANHEGDHAHGHGHHGDHHGDSRAQRQGASDVDVSFPAVAGASPGSDGKRCIDKVEMVEETEYDDVVQCDHSCYRRCHTT